MKTDAEREESFPLLLSTKIPLLKSTRHNVNKGCRGESKSGQLWRAKAERLLGKEEVYFMPYL